MDKKNRKTSTVELNMDPLRPSGFWSERTDLKWDIKDDDVVNSVFWQ